jgi:hypothetical protein
MPACNCLALATLQPFGGIGFDLYAVAQKYLRCKKSKLLVCIFFSLVLLLLIKCFFQEVSSIILCKPEGLL